METNNVNKDALPEGASVTHIFQNSRDMPEEEEIM